MMKVRFMKLVPNAVLPTYAHDGDAGLDIVANGVKEFDKEEILQYTTGIAVQIPKGYFGLLVPRSSIYRTKNWLVNSCGIIDHGYTGEILINMDTRLVHSKRLKIYKPGERIAQLIILKYPTIEVVEAVRFNTKSDRGDGGFGSSGQ